MALPLASVVVDNYNYARYLPAAIDSALAQTYPNTEVVVVDDGSTDSSADVIRAYGSRVEAVFRPNGGQAAAFNAGFAASQGETVILLDSDDVLLPEAVERATQAFTDGVPKVHWPLHEIDAAGRRTGRLTPRQPLPEGDLEEELVREGPHALVHPPTSGNAWARWFLESVLPMPEPQFRRLADAYLLTLAPLEGPIAKVDEPLGCYRVHDRNEFAGTAGVERARRFLEVYDARCEALAQRLRESGRPVDDRAWHEGNSHYAWLRRLVAAADDLAALVPSGAAFAFADEGKSGHEWGDGELVAGRRAIPFPDRDGGPWGAPADGDEAVRELERARDAGAEVAAFAWPAFWYLEHYPELAAHLRRYPRLLDNERLVVFDLREEAPA